MKTPFVYENVSVIRIIDGDTVELRLDVEKTLDVDFGFYTIQKVTLHTSIQQKFRLAGINTPEVVGESRSAGLSATEALRDLLRTDRPIRATTFKPDKYGRWLVALEILQEDGSALDINQELVNKGFAKPYMAGSV